MNFQFKDSSDERKLEHHKHQISEKETIHQLPTNENKVHSVKELSIGVSLNRYFLSNNRIVIRINIIIRVLPNQ